MSLFLAEDLMLPLLSPTHATTKKKRETLVSLLLVPLDVLFSNEFLRDLSRLWELRSIVPDPSNPTLVIR